MKLAVDVTDGRTDPGAWVRGRVRVVEGGSARELRIALQYRERTEDFLEIAFRGPDKVLHTGDLADGQSFDFALAMPADALPSLQMRHSELYWAVAARCARRGLDVEAHTKID